MSEPTREEDEYVWVKRVPIIDEAMIERAAEELEAFCFEVEGATSFKEGAWRILRAALEVRE